MLFTETAHFVVNFLLSCSFRASRPPCVPAARLPRRRPRATPPHPLDQELCSWGCRRPALPKPAARRRLGDYWLSLQRHRPPGAAWGWLARRILLRPGATGLADVSSASPPAHYGARPRLTFRPIARRLRTRIDRVIEDQLAASEQE